MTDTYLDTSALLRRLMREGDYQLVNQAMRANPVTVVPTRVELHAAIYKRWRDGELSVAERDSLLGIVGSNVEQALSWLPLDNATLSEAQAIVASYPVRSLDALHLATAVLAERRLSRLGTDLNFCTADPRQAEAAGAIFGTARVLFVPPWR